MLAGVGACGGDIAKDKTLIAGQERPGGSQSEVVCDVAIASLAHPNGRGTETKQARVEPGEMLADPRIVGEVVVNDLFEFHVLQIGRAATNREHVTDVGILEALQENAAAYHAGGAKQDDPHAVPMNRRPRLEAATPVLSHD